MKNIIWFKSNDENFNKEIRGLKPNTIRFVGDWSIYRWVKYRTADYIGMKNKNTGEKFIRPITDKTLYMGIAIISWDKDGGNENGT